MTAINQKRLAVFLAALMAIIVAAVGVFLTATALMHSPAPTPVTPTPPPVAAPSPTQTTTPGASGYVFTGEGPGERVTKIGGLMSDDGIEVRANNLRMEYTVGSAAACVDITISNYRPVPVPYTNTDWRIQTPSGLAMPMSYQRSGAILGSGVIPPDHGVSGVICRMGNLTDEGEYIVTYSPDIAATLEGSEKDSVEVNPADMTFFGWTHTER